MTKILLREALVLPNYQHLLEPGRLYTETVFGENTGDYHYCMDIKAEALRDLTANVETFAEESQAKEVFVSALYMTILSAPETMRKCIKVLAWREVLYTVCSPQSKIGDA